jgi:phage baseplate assembly protein gpV
MLNLLFQQNVIKDDPSTLLFLIKTDNFMTNYLAMLKNNPKAQQRL